MVFQTLLIFVVIPQQEKQVDANGCSEQSKGCRINDGVSDAIDICGKYSLWRKAADANGCSEQSKGADNLMGVFKTLLILCANNGNQKKPVDVTVVQIPQKDGDNDGVSDGIDKPVPIAPTGEKRQDYSDGSSEQSERYG